MKIKIKIGSIAYWQSWLKKTTGEHLLGAKRLNYIFIKIQKELGTDPEKLAEEEKYCYLKIQEQNKWNRI